MPQGAPRSMLVNLIDWLCLDRPKQSWTGAECTWNNEHAGFGERSNVGSLHSAAKKDRMKSNHTACSSNLELTVDNSRSHGNDAAAMGQSFTMLQSSADVLQGKLAFDHQHVTARDNHRYDWAITYRIFDHHPSELPLRACSCRLQLVSMPVRTSVPRLFPFILASGTTLMKQVKHACTTIGELLEDHAHHGIFIGLQALLMPHAE